MSIWYQLEPTEVLRQLGTANSGLSVAETNERLARYGKNKLRERPPKSPLVIKMVQRR
jgi:Ca2+-transporting ATPase